MRKLVVPHTYVLLFPVSYTHLDVYKRQLIGMPTLKLMGDYYAIASIGLVESIRLILENWQSLTRGARGYPGIEGFTTLPVALIFFAVMTIVMINLINSRYGRAFKACRDDYLAASLLGYNTAFYRILSLAISGFYCGIAGRCV